MTALPSHPMEVRLGRQPFTPPADALRAVDLIAKDATPRTEPWPIGPVLDQGQTPECVGFTGRDVLNAGPVSDPDQANPTPQALYAGAQQFDGIPGPHDGSTDHGLIQYMRNLGYVVSAGWAQTIDEAIQFLTTTGPLMVGMPWDYAMFTPDANGVVHRDGNVRGGHEWLIYWYDAATDLFWCMNHWGTGWGQAGLFKISRADLQSLFAQGGDICLATFQLPAPQPPQPPPYQPRWRLIWTWWGWRWFFGLKNKG